MPRHDPDKKTKQYILETAMRLFSEKGLENVNIEDVVKEVGVTRGAFYHYFKSREELLEVLCINLLNVITHIYSLINKRDLTPLKNFALWPNLVYVPFWI